MIKNILIIDDDEVTLRIVELTLARHSFAENAIKFTNVKDALTYFEQLSSGKAKAKPDLILLDICMPALDGWDFLEEYSKRFERQFPTIPICMLSSSVDPEDPRKANTYPGVIAFIDKTRFVEEINKLRNHESLKHFFTPTTK